NTVGAATQPAATEPISTQPVRSFTALGQLLGQLPLSNDGPTAFDDRFSSMGLIDRDGRRLTFAYVMFIDPFEGVPAFVRWLREQGCDEFRYEFDSGDANSNDG